MKNTYRENDREGKTVMFRLREKILAQLFTGLFALSLALAGQDAFAKPQPGSDPKIIGFDRINNDDSFLISWNDGSYAIADMPASPDGKKLRTAHIRGDKVQWIYEDGSALKTPLPERRQADDASVAKKAPAPGAVAKSVANPSVGDTADKDKAASGRPFGEGQGNPDTIKVAGVQTPATPAPDKLYGTPESGDPSIPKPKSVVNKPAGEGGFDLGKHAKAGLIGAASLAATYFGLGPAGLGLFGVSAAVFAGIGAFGLMYWLSTSGNLDAIWDFIKPVAVVGIIGGLLGTGLAAAMVPAGASVTFGTLAGGFLAGGLIGIGIGAVFALIGLFSK